MNDSYAFWLRLNFFYSKFELLISITNIYLWIIDKKKYELWFWYFRVFCNSDWSIFMTVKKWSKRKILTAQFYFKFVQSEQLTNIN